MRTVISVLVSPAKRVHVRVPVVALLSIALLIRLDTMMVERALRIVGSPAIPVMPSRVHPFVKGVPDKRGCILRGRTLVPSIPIPASVMLAIALSGRLRRQESSRACEHDDR